MRTIDAKKPITLKDVAAHAGVSPSVVSHVLHQKSKWVRVSDATTARVRKSAAELNYRVNVYARNFRDRQTTTIGVLTATRERPRLDARSSYMADLIEGIVAGAFERGYSVALCPKLMGDSPEEAVADGRFDGLIWYSGHWMSDAVPILNACPIPLVLIHDNPAEAKAKYPCVCCDNQQGIGLAIDHLVELGHRKLMFVGDRYDTFFEASVRRDAFLWHMGKHGLEASIGGINSRDETFGEFPELGVETAIVASNDGVAEYVIAAAKKRGLRVPRDLSLVGFDSAVQCELSHPKLTSVRQPLTEVGSIAASILIHNIQEGGGEPVQVVLPCTLDVRKSTAPPRG